MVLCFLVLLLLSDCEMIDLFPMRGRGVVEGVKKRKKQRQKLSELRPEDTGRVCFGPLPSWETSHVNLISTK